jgi:hypothetical protein
VWIRYIDADSGVSAPEDFELSTLCVSMKEIGLLNPVSLIALGDANFRLLAGRRRLHAAKKLRWFRVPAMVWPADTPDDLQAAIKLSENLHRTSLSHLDRAALSGQFSKVTNRQVAVHNVLHSGTKKHVVRTPEQKARRQRALDAKCSPKQATNFANWPLTEEADTFVLSHGLAGQRWLLELASRKHTAEEQIEVLRSQSPMGRKAAGQELL